MAAHGRVAARGVLRDDELRLDRREDPAPEDAHQRGVVAVDVGGDPPGEAQATSLSNWDFHEKCCWLNQYLIMKSNTRLFNATTHIHDKKDFDVLRIMNDELNKIPDNAKSQVNVLLGNAVWTNGRTQRMKDIKVTCGMAGRLDAVCIGVRRQVGYDPSKERLTELVWQILDPETLS